MAIIEGSLKRKFDSLVLKEFSFDRNTGMMTAVFAYEDSKTHSTFGKITFNYLPKEPLDVLHQFIAAAEEGAINVLFEDENKNASSPATDNEPEPFGLTEEAENRLQL